MDSVRNTAFLLLDWTEQKHHAELIEHINRGLFPIIPSDEEHWQRILTCEIFNGKSPAQLLTQTAALLDILLQISTKDFRPSGSLDVVSSDFTPLQNICLYLQAFGLDYLPLDALRPLDVAKLGTALHKLEIHHQEATEDWDSRLRKVLPIACPRERNVMNAIRQEMLEPFAEILKN